MSWGKVCDTLHGHRKAARAGLEAMGLWVLAMSWSRDKGTAGRIPADRPALLADDPEAAARCAEALVRARLWDVEEDGWRFHDWAEYQESDEQSEARKVRTSAARAAAGRAGAAARWQTDGNCHEPMANDGKDGTSPLPSPPIPLRDPDPPVSPPAGDPPTAKAITEPASDFALAPTGPSPKPRARRPKVKLPLPADWKPDEGLFMFGRELGLDRARVTLELSGKMRDHAAANGVERKDWAAAARNWLREAKSRDGQRGRPAGAPAYPVQSGGAWRPRAPAMPEGDCNEAWGIGPEVR